MARELTGGLGEFLSSGRGANIASWCVLTLPEVPGSPSAQITGKAYHLATRNVTIDGVPYDPSLKDIGQIKRSVNRAAEQITVSIQNVDTVFGSLLLKDINVLHGATVRVGRYWHDPASGARWSRQMFVGVVDGASGDEQNVNLRCLSDYYAVRAVGGGRAVELQCQAVFNSPAVRATGSGMGDACGYTGTDITCDKLKATCNTKSNLFRFQGFVNIESAAPVSGTTNQPAPNYSMVLEADGTPVATARQLKFANSQVATSGDVTTVTPTLTDGYFVDAAPYNAVGDGSTDDTAAIQDAHDAALADGGGIVYLGAKEYAVTNLLWDARVQLKGEGWGRSVLLSTDSTKSVFEATGGTLNFLGLSNFTIEGAGTGSNNHGIYTHSVTDEVYMARFDQLEIKNCGGRGIYLDAMFSCHFNFVFVTNCGDNLFDLKGGNTVALYNCYADDVAANKTGYRIHRGQVTMVNCNGIDSLGTGTSWAIFGDKTSEDGVDAYVDATLIGCNAENFKLYGVRCKEGSRAEYFSTFFTASASGSAHVAILHDYTADNPGILSSSCRFNTNGGTWANSLPIHSNNDMPVLCLGHNNQTQYYYDGGASAQTLLRVDVTSLGGTKYVDIVRGAMTELAISTDGGGDIGPNETFRPRDVNATRYVRAGSYLISVDGLLSTYFSNSASAASTWSRRRGRGTSGSPTAVQSGDVLGYDEWAGQYDTTDGHRNAGAYLTVSATETFSGSAAGTKFEWTAAENGSTNGFSKGFGFDPSNGNGTVYPKADNSQYLGYSSKRWARVYTGGVYFNDGTSQTTAATSNTTQAARVSSSSTQSINNITWTPLTFDTETRDDGGFHSVASNLDRMTAPATGWYQISAQIEFAANNTGSRMVRFYLNGTTEIARAALASIATYSTYVPLSISYYLTSADYVTCDVFQDSGGNLNVGTGSFYQIHRIY